jgi:hypothetical protein
MGEALAILTVGTQEAQSDLLTAHVSERLGPEVRVQGRLLGEGLAGLDDELLCEVLSDATVRNGPCFRALDERAAGWSVALLATDQPEHVPQRAGDTVGIAWALRRWFALTRPHVTVLDPYVLDHRPDLPDERLAETIEGCVRDAVERVRPRDLMVLPVGGTPAMRVLTERAAGLVAELPGTVSTLLPDAADPGTVIDTTVMRLLRRDHTREVLARLCREAFRGARFEAAAQHAEAMTRIGLDGAEELRRLAGEAAGLLEKGDWPQRTAARIAVVKRLERDRRADEALVQATVAAELMAVVWARHHGIEDVCAQVRCRKRPCAKQPRSVTPAHMQGGPGDRPPGEVDAARGVALCATIRCEQCPLRVADSSLRTLWEDREGARRAVWLRDAPRTRHPLVQARNVVAHLEPHPGVGIDEVVRREQQALADAGIARLRVTGLAHLLRVAHHAVTGNVPSDPLDALEARVDELLAGSGGATPI